MSAHLPDLAGLLLRVRLRLRARSALRATTVAAAGAGLALVLALFTQWMVAPQGLAFAALWTAAVLVVAVSFASSIPALGRIPPDHQIARYIEERCPELEDALATALADHRQEDSSAVLAAVADDAARRAGSIDLDRVVSRAHIRKAGLRAGVALLAFSAALALSIDPAGRAARILALHLFPGQTAFDVAPGDIRIRAGESVRIRVRIPGVGTAVVPLLRVQAGEDRRDQSMHAVTDGYEAAFDDVRESFRYAVSAAGATSREFRVEVLRPPQVQRIDLRYEYPAVLRMDPRMEEDGGDIYAPAGTRVRVIVHTDKPVSQASVDVAGDASVPLSIQGDALEGTLTVERDGSYRVALSDADGLHNPGDTEYFIRTVQDRPPDVRIIRPGSDRPVTPIEEVTIEARADDDFGVAALELVYAVRGGRETVVPFSRDGSALTVNGLKTVYLEDLDVEPGDFVAYYARTRDVGRGKPPSEARSDIFFLEVKPFEEEFVASPGQGSGGGGDAALDDLVEAQKDVITATWKLDRRARTAGGEPAGDIRAVGRAQLEIRRRAFSVSIQNQRTEDLRRRLRGQGTGNRAAGSEDSAMAKAVDAMDKASRELQSLRTSAALPHEMAALNELLRAQADVRRRQVQQQASNGGGGSGSNRQTQDLSSLFDRELARQQQTNYETPNTTEARNPDGEEGRETLEKVRELARRQESINREREDLASKRLPEEEIARQLERLTREQNELRQQADDLARQLQQQDNRSGGQPRQAQGGQGQRADQRQSPGNTGRSMQQIAEDMRSAASGMRRPDRGQAGAGGSRALERLRDLERQMRGTRPDEQYREIGDMQLETRQLADAQRRLADDTERQGAPVDADDRARRRAAEQNRLAERAERLEQSVRQLAAGSGGSTEQQAALTKAAQAVQRERVSERMRRAARNASGDRGGAEAPAQPGRSARGGSAQEEREIARSLDRVAERLAGASGERASAGRLAAELSRALDLRDRLASADRQLAEMRRDLESPQEQNRGRGRAAGAGGRGEQGQGQATSGEWERARELLEQLRREGDSGLSTRDLEGFNPGISAPGTEAWKQDFRRWDELSAKAAAALEKIERSAAARLREELSTDRLNAGATQAIPEQYRPLVAKYFEALAK